MDPRRWSQLEELFHRACECDPLQRAQFLDESCNGDMELRGALEALLANDERADHDLQTTVWGCLDAVAFPLLGETISHYRILGGIDTGGMGSVYRAEDVKLGRHVALKFLAEEFATDPTALSRFEREARSASALEHPNICPIYEFGEHDGQPFLAMQLLEGHTLRELISRNSYTRPPFALPELLSVALQITEALDAAHRHGIIHRDIKPANIFITRQGQAKILDFGLAKPTDGEIGHSESILAAGVAAVPHETGDFTRGRPTPDAFLSRTGVALGTSAYMSPEQARGEKLDARTDIFSLGLVLYEMATGHRAFEGATEPILHDAIFRQTPAPARQLNPRLPARFEAIVHRALQAKREARYQTAAELRADLEAVKQTTEGRNASRLGVLVATLRAWMGATQSARAGTDTPLQVRQKTIAVLPFRDLSQKKDQEYFADGIAEEILNLMSRVPGLRVIARTSSFRFRGNSNDLGSIATRLGAGFVVEGSVRQSGSRVRVSARLIDTTDGVQRWANSYERGVSDVLKVQEEIAVNLVSALQVEVAPEVIATLRAPPASAEAYDAFRRGLHAAYRFDQAGLQQAVGHFRRALELDPSFVTPADALAAIFDILTEWQVLPPSQGWKEARAAANLALQLDPESPGGHIILGNIHTYYDWDRAAAAREINTALQLAPNNVFGLVVAAKERLVVGDWAESLRLLNLAISVDPFEPFLFAMRGILFQRTNRTSDAKKDFRRALEISPAYPRIRTRIAEVLLVEGNPEAALAELRQDTPCSLKGLALVNHALKRHDESDAALARLVSRRASIAPMSIAEVYAFRGQIEEAFEWLERAIAQKEVTTGHIKGDPLLSSLMANPRYARCLRKMNLPSDGG